MRYLLMIYEDPATAPRTPEAWEAMMAEYGAYTAWLQETGQFLGGEALQDVADATTVAVRDGRRIITDGPFAETKEQLGGYFLVDCADLDEAIEVASKIPTAKVGTIEVRPVWELEM